MAPKFADQSTIKARVAYVKAAMASNDKWLIRGLLAIYRGQTPEEQAVGATVEDNGIGFSGVDAEILTSFAVQHLDRQAEARKHGRDNRIIYLSDKQIQLLREKMGKYARQLVRISATNKGD